MLNWCTHTNLLLSLFFFFFLFSNYVNYILLNLQIVLLFLHDMYRYVKLNQRAIQKARRILTFGQRSIAEKITSVDIYMSNSSAYITTNSIVIWNQLLSDYEKFSMSTKDVNVQQKSKAYFIKKYHPLHHKETEKETEEKF